MFIYFISPQSIVVLYINSVYILAFQKPLSKHNTTEQITIMIIVHISVLKTPLVRDAANPAVTIVTAVCIVNIVA